MNIQITKTDYRSLLDLTEKCVVFVQGHNPTAEDLIRVICADGKTVYWCDSIEFITED